ncbi:MAG TPA: hypothetical protein VJI33_03980 [Candidatus Paceibacterota bacterium]
MRLERNFLMAEQNELIAKACQKADKVINRDEIKLSDFAGSADADRLRADEAYVAKREAEFAKVDSPEEVEGLKWSRVLEALIHEQGEQSNWFGPDAVTIKTSRYDDIARGVDEVVQFRKEDAGLYFLGLAIDATYSHDAVKKLKTIREEIEKGTLASLRYFISEDADIKGEFNNIPRVIVGVDKKTVGEVAELWLGGKSKELAAHPIQFQILEQILEQCETFAKYAAKIGQNDVARKYESTASIIKDVLTEKQKTIKDSGTRDDVHFSIATDLRTFENL